MTQPTAQRAVWSGTITWALVSVPVKMYSATQENDIAFHQGHTHEDGRDVGRINQKKFCTVCAEEVPYDQLVKTYDTEDGPVVLTKADFDALPLTSTKAVEVQEFVPADQVDPMLFERTYYLAPAVKAGQKAYSLLRYAIQSERVVGIVKVTIRQREQLAMLHVRDGGIGPVLALTTLKWADEVRRLNVPLMADLPWPSDQELGMVSTLVQMSTSEKFDASAYEDGYRAALEQVIESNRAGMKPVIPVAQTDSKAGDLVAALMASIEAKKKELVAA